MELLKALAQPSNQGILIVLAAEPSYARRIGSLLDLTESQVTRRLRAMEVLGLVEGRWEHIGRNVKMYRSTAAAIRIHFDAEGMHVDLEEGQGSTKGRLVDPFEPRIPDARDLVGREVLLESLRATTPVVGLEGIAGIGKTSILAAAAHAADGPVFWHSFRGVESLTWLLNRMAVFLASHGQNDLLHAIQDDAELAELRERFLASFDGAGLHYYFDDVHAVRDEAILALLRDLAEAAHRSRLRMASRETLPVHTGTQQARVHVVDGLDDDAAVTLLDHDGVAWSHDAAPLHRLGGHPLALHLFADVAIASDVPLGGLLDGAPPGPLVDFLLREVEERLSDAERRILVHASLFRRGFTIDALRAITRVHQVTVLGLQRKHLLEGAGSFFVMHEMVRGFFEGFVEDAPALHALLADHLLETGSVEDRIEAMHHLIAAGRDDEALALLEDNLDLHDFDFIDSGYAGLYEDILSRFDEDDVDERSWALIQDELGDIRFQGGDHERALAHYHVADAYFSAHADDTTRDEDIAWKRAMALQHLGRNDDAMASVEAGLAHAPDGLEKDRLEALWERLRPDPRVESGKNRK